MGPFRLDRPWGLSLGLCCCIAACGSPTAGPLETDEIASSPQISADSVDGSPGVAAPTSTAPEAVPTPDQRLENTQIIPGERVGPVTLETSRADLVALFGAEALADVAVPAGEGTTEPGTRVDLGPEQSFSVVWVDDTQTRPWLVKDFGSAWRTPEGIGLGITFAELQAVLGPFSFYGFGWDYGGTVVLADTTLAGDDGLLIIRLQPDIDGNTAPSGPLQAVMGDRTFSSETVNLTNLGVTVGEMIVYLNATP